MDARYNPRSLEHRGLDTEAFKRSFLEGLVYTVGKDTRAATRRDWFTTSAFGVRDRLVDRWMETTRNYYKADAKRVYYLSLEFLIGRLLGNSLVNLGMMQAVGEALDELGYGLDDMRRAWSRTRRSATAASAGWPPASWTRMATLGCPAIGYGIRYEYGIFQPAHRATARRSSIPDALAPVRQPVGDSPGRRSRSACSSTAASSTTRDEHGRRAPTSGSTPSDVLAMPYDTPDRRATAQRRSTRCACGRRGRPATSTSATSTAATTSKAVEQKIQSREHLAACCIRTTTSDAGQELRLKQEYFFVPRHAPGHLRRYSAAPRAASTGSPDKVAIQLNDTHPAMAIAELMRLLVDVHALDWDEAWDDHQRTLRLHQPHPDARGAGAWPVRLFERLLPRHLQIIYEINRRFLEQVAGAARATPRACHACRSSRRTADRASAWRTWPSSAATASTAWPALHTRADEADGLRRLAHRVSRSSSTTRPTASRRAAGCSSATSALSDLITEPIGSGWVSEPERTGSAEASRRRRRLPRASAAAVKRQNKMRLAALIGRELNVEVDPVDSMFDVQVKRIHEYKRQLLNVLHDITLYNDMQRQPDGQLGPAHHDLRRQGRPGVPHGQADHPADQRRRQSVVNQRPVGPRAAEGRLPAELQRVAGRDHLARRRPVGADLDRRHGSVGHRQHEVRAQRRARPSARWTAPTSRSARRSATDNIFIFGLTAEEAGALRHGNAYNPREVIAANPPLKRALDMIASGVFSPDDPHRYRPLIQALTDGGDFVPGHGRFPSLPRSARSGGRPLPQPGPVDAEGRHQHGVNGLVLQRPDHRRICLRDLERRTGSAGVVFAI